MLSICDSESETGLAGHLGLEPRHFRREVFDEFQVPWTGTIKILMAPGRSLSPPINMRTIRTRISVQRLSLLVDKDHASATVAPGTRRHDWLNLKEVDLGFGCGPASRFCLLACARDFSVEGWRATNSQYESLNPKARSCERLETRGLQQLVMMLGNYNS